MSYSVKISDRAKKSLKKIDKFSAGIILNWIDKRLNGCENPRLYGKGLTANRSGEWRYRIGDYRLLVDIKDDELIILALAIKHRKHAYD